MARVVQFSGVCDASYWPQLTSRATPGGRYFALASNFDTLICPVDLVQLPSWIGEAAVPPSSTWFDERNASDLASASPTLLSLVLPPSCLGCANVSESGSGDFGNAEFGSGQAIPQPECPCDNSSLGSPLYLAAHNVVAEDSLQSVYARGAWHHVLGIHPPTRVSCEVRVGGTAWRCFVAAAVGTAVGVVAIAAIAACLLVLRWRGRRRLFVHADSWGDGTGAHTHAEDQGRGDAASQAARLPTVGKPGLRESLLGAIDSGDPLPVN